MEKIKKRMKPQTLNHLVYLMKRSVGQLLFIVLLCNLTLASDLNGQKSKSIFDIPFEISCKNKPILAVFEEIEFKTDFKFAYDTKVLKGKSGVTVYEKTLGETLAAISVQAGLNFRQVNEVIAVTKPRNNEQPKPVEVLIYDKNIQGKVTDGSGEPLVGATVTVKNATVGTITNLDGSFTLSVPDDAESLIISYIGFKTQEIAIGGRSTFDVSLQEDVSSLSEVVVVAYGVQKKSDVTGAISSVKSEAFNQGVVTNPGQLLQGKVAGVNITNTSGEPGAAQNIIIRGVGSLRSGTTPLFVVDGFLLDNISAGMSSNPLNFLNPSDIASMEVLKDASAAALYGTRASNGVVVITTKKGRAGKTQISLSATTAWSSIANKMEVFSADEFRTRVNSIGGVLDDRGGNTDWQDVLTQRAFSQDYNLSLSGGGSDRFSYYTSLGVQQQEGILKNSKLERYSGKLNMNQVALDGRVKVDYNLSASRTENLRPDISATINDMLDLNPTYSPETDGVPTFLPNDRINPLLRNQLYSDEAFNNRILARISPSVEIIDGLVYKLNGGVDYSNTTRYLQNRPITLSQYDQVGTLRTVTTENTNRLIENTLSYKFDLGKHAATFLGGHSYQKFFESTRALDQSGFDDSPIEPRYRDYQSSEAVITTVDAYAVENELQSYFGRMDYSYDGKYLLTATMRADGSSKFGKNNRYGYFPSFAVGWNVAKERFFSNSAFDNLKLRVSWGQTGNQEIPAKITQESFTEGKGQTRPLSQLTYPLEDDQTTIDDYPVGISFTRFANPDIQWEVSTQTNVGFDFAFLDFRLSGTLDYFYKVSDNVLLEVTPPDPISPTSTFWTNVPEMEIRNAGIELSLDYSNKPGAAFQWNIGGNLSYMNNEIANSPYRVLTTGAAQGGGQTGATINGYLNDEPVGTFYTLIFDGIGENGQSQYVDFDLDNEITDDDRRVAGTALPNFLYAFYANLKYHAFDLSLNFNGVSGNEIYNHNRMEFFNRGRLSTSNNTTAFATEFADESNTNSNTVSSRYLEDGSFLRLNNVALGYTLTPDRLGWSGNSFTSFRLFVTGQNLFVITDYSGFDPEVNTGVNQAGIQTFGIDRLTYPAARTFMLGLNATF